MMDKELKKAYKRSINHLRKKCGYGKYLVDCRYLPCLVVETEFKVKDSNPFGYNGVIVKSLVHKLNDRDCSYEASCSIMHCGLEPITKEEAIERATFINKFGLGDAYFEKYYPNEHILSES